MKLPITANMVFLIQPHSRLTDYTAWIQKHTAWKIIDQRGVSVAGWFIGFVRAQPV